MTRAWLQNQVVATAPKKIGLLSDMTSALLGAGVEVRAITGYDSEAGGQVMLICDEPAAAADALEKMGASVSFEECVLMEIPDELGALDEAARRITEAGVNIDWMYETSAGCDEAWVVFQTADNEAVAALFG
jgi:hypothetical protein